VTIEGLGRPGRLHALQQAFIDHGAAQCGYCTPGMLLTAKSWLDAHPGIVPEADAVREAIAGTLCRCTGYQKIVEAVRAAAAALLQERR
jgi:aerobic carbon-monoxide dehydrogenase small subunit